MLAYSCIPRRTNWSRELPRIAVTLGFSLLVICAGVLA